VTPSIPVWRLTRSTSARRLYDALAGAGVRVAVLDHFQSDLSEPLAGSPTPPERIRIERVAAAERPAHWDVSDPGLEADHAVLGAVADDELVGVALLSSSGPVYVDPLARTVAFDGGYLWGVEVDPAWRRRGIASALVSTADAYLREAGAPAAHALVAPDNVPSRTLFRNAGFEPRRRHVYVGLGRFAHRSSRSHTGGSSPEKR